MKNYQPAESSKTQVHEENWNLEAEAYPTELIGPFKMIDYHESA